LGDRHPSSLVPARVDTRLLVLSIDSTCSHVAWLRTVKEKIEYKGMKNIEVTFPLISDLKMAVSKAFGMLQPANWQPGDDVIVPPPGSCGSTKERVEKPAADTKVLDWFMCLKKCPQR
jgi:alkyl hydroperoxide reductase subunit AhpC